MPSLQKDARLFGLDLAPLGRDFVTAWRGMLDWPVLAWLWPQPQVRLWLPDGQQAISRGPDTPAQTAPSGQPKTRFQAIVLPEDILLRRSLVLPMLAQAELESALALQLQAFSPFAPEDLVWTYESQAIDGGVSLQVHAALSSRPLIAAHLAATDPAASLDNFEVWVPQTQDGRHVLVPGFAEGRRQSRSTAWRWASATLLLVALALVATMAATPSLQLYLRSKQAEAALSALQQKAIPVLSEREAFTLATEKLGQLSDMLASSTPPMPVLQLITEALADDTSLLSVQVQGNKVSLSGQTVNTSSLMKQLSTTPGLKDVRAPAPATKPPGATRESFTIEFSIDPDLWAAARPLAAADPASLAASAPAPAASVPAPAAASAAKAAAPSPAAASAAAAPASSAVKPPPAAPPAKPQALPANPLAVPVAPSKTP